MCNPSPRIVCNLSPDRTGGIRRVEVRDCVAEAGNWAPVRIKTQPTRSGVVEDIVYRNLELHGVKQAFEFDLEWNMKIATPAARRCVPTVRNVKIIGARGTAEFVGKIHGLPDSFVDGVKFEDCNVTANRGLLIDHARAIDLSGLKLQVRDAAPVTWK